MILCPYCLNKKARARVTEVSRTSCFIHLSCNPCQKIVDKAILKELRGKIGWYRYQYTIEQEELLPDKQSQVRASELNPTGIQL